MKTVVSVVILFISIVASNAHAATGGGIATQGYRGQPKKEKFTPQEKEFLANIAVRAQEIVQTSLERTQFQYDQITRRTKFRESTLSAIKSAYQQYKTYLVMSKYSSYVNPRVAAQMTNMTLGLKSDYSPYQVKITPNERKIFEQTFNEDREFLKNNLEKCGLGRDSMAKHYKKQLGEILALAPVVLQIEAKGSIPTDLEVTSAYEELIDSMQQTFAQFEDYDSSQIEGLWGYQGIAQEMVFEDPQLEPIYESLRIKIEPQGFLEKTFAYIWGILPAMAPLTCSIVAIATANPLMGLICGSLNLYLASKNLYASYEMVEQKRREWLSGVSPFQNIESAQKQLFVDQILLGFNIFAGASILRATDYSLITDLNFHKSNILSTLGIKEIESKARVYAKQVSKGELEGQAKYHVALGLTHLLRPDYLSVDKLSQATTSILVSYLRKGMFTFKDTANAICKDTQPQLAGN